MSVTFHLGSVQLCIMGDKNLTLFFLCSMCLLFKAALWSTVWMNYQTIWVGGRWTVKMMRKIGNTLKEQYRKYKLKTKGRKNCIPWSLIQRLHSQPSVIDWWWGWLGSTHCAVWCHWHKTAAAKELLVGLLMGWDRAWCWPGSWCVPIESALNSLADVRGDPVWRVFILCCIDLTMCSFVCVCILRCPAPQRNFEIAFKMFDLNGDGEVDLEEFEQVRLWPATHTHNQHIKRDTSQPTSMQYVECNNIYSSSIFVDPCTGVIALYFKSDFTLIDLGILMNVLH